MWISWPWPVGGSIAPSVLVRRDPQNPHGWNAMLCASESRLTDRFTPPPRRAWNQPQPLSPFTVKSSNPAIQASVLLFWSNPLIFPLFLSSNPFKLTRLAAFISSTRSPAKQQLSHLTEWREADAPEFSEPLTFFIAPFLMPSLLTRCGGAPWRNKWETLEEQFDHRGALKKKKKSSIFSFSSTLLAFGRVITHDAQRNGVSPQPETRITETFLCLFLSFSGLFLQHRLGTSFGVPRTTV